MMTLLIDVLVGSVVIPISIASLLIAALSSSLILRNIGARISVVRAIVASPNLLGEILCVEPIRTFLLEATKQNGMNFNDEEIEGLLRFLLLSQAHRLARENNANEVQVLNRDNAEVDYQLFQRSISALHLLMEERKLFNDAISHIVEKVIRSNSDDLIAAGWFAKITSMNWFAMKLGGANRSVVGYFVRFMFRDAILNLIERVSEMGCVFVSEKRIKAA